MHPPSLDIGDSQTTIHQENELRDDAPEDSYQDLWRQFAAAANYKEFCQSWLSLQCATLKKVRSGLLLLGPPDQGPFTPAAIWPSFEYSVTHLTAAAERALRERRGLVFSGNAESGMENFPLNFPQVAFPLEVAGKIHGVIVLEVEPSSTSELQDLLRQLYWGSAWLEVMLWRADTLKLKETNERLQRAFDLLAIILEHERSTKAAMAFVTQLATKLNCDRVSLGFEESKKPKVVALSHSAQFGRQMNLLRAIEKAMSEALDQQAVIVFPQPPDALPLVTRAHAELARQHGAGHICTIPLRSAGKFCGALTLERPEGSPFDEPTRELSEVLGTLVGPIFEAKRREERWLITKAGESLTRQLQKVFGAGHLALKLVCLLLAALVVFFIVAEGDFRVTSTTSLEGTIQRAISAPFNGFIAEARVRAGDVVKPGELLCLMDDRDLKLERLKWATQKEQLSKEYGEALAKHDRPKVMISKAKIDQAEAQIALLDEQLARTKVTAPFGGIIIKGDLSQSLGAPVERGQVLFELAPLDSYRVIVEVDERDIAEIAKGQKGELRLPSLPGEVFPLVIERITSVTFAKEGRNYFRVEAQIHQASPRLRPGMAGVSKIYVDQRKLIWIWTHELIDWLRLTLWKWIP